MNRNDGVVVFGRELRIGTEQLLLEQIVVVVVVVVVNESEANRCRWKITNRKEVNRTSTMLLLLRCRCRKSERCCYVVVGNRNGTMLLL